MFGILSFKVNKIQKKTRKSERKNRKEGLKRRRKTNFIIFTLTTETWIYSTIYSSALKGLQK